MPTHSGLRPPKYHSENADTQQPQSWQHCRSKAPCWGNIRSTPLDAHDPQTLRATGGWPQLRPTPGSWVDPIPLRHSKFARPDHEPPHSGTLESDPKFLVRRAATADQICVPHALSQLLAPGFQADIPHSHAHDTAQPFSIR